MRLPPYLLLAVPLLAILAACTRKEVPPPRFAAIGHLQSFDRSFSEVVAGDARIEKLSEGFTWSEGPAWVRNGGYLLFTDVPENKLYRWSEDAGLSVLLSPSGYSGPEQATLREAGANGLYAEPGGTVLLADSGTRIVARLDPATRKKTPLATQFEGHRFNSPNDLVRRSDGVVFFTDPPYGLKGMNDSPVKELRYNGVYRLDTDGSVHLLDDSLSLPNGIALSPDARTLYVANSDPDRPIWMAYTLDAAGAVTGKRVSPTPPIWSPRTRPACPTAWRSPPTATCSPPAPAASSCSPPMAAGWAVLKPANPSPTAPSATTAICCT